MKLFIRSWSCEYEGGCFNSTTDHVYSIDVRDYITRTTLAHIIKDKENMTEHNFEAIRLISDGKQIYPGPFPPLPLRHSPERRSREQIRMAWHNVMTYKHSKLSEISDINDNSHIRFLFRIRG